ncbi:cold shock domain-containing protein [bacterium]|nr:cold shock domain-containing protein [bacterium]
MNEDISTVRQRGIVTNFLPRKGYGFIRSSDGISVFVHFSAIRGGDYRTLIPGEEVEYTMVQAQKGPQALDVLRLNPPQEEEPVILTSLGKTW